MAGETLGSLMYTFVQMFVGIIILLYGSVPSLYNKYKIFKSNKALRIGMIIFGSLFFIYFLISLFYTVY